MQTDSDVAKIVLESIQAMLLKIALQMARDDYEERRKRQAAGIAKAKENCRFKGRSADTGKHRLIVSLREHHTIQETARLPNSPPAKQQPRCNTTAICYKKCPS